MFAQSLGGGGGNGRFSISGAGAGMLNPAQQAVLADVIGNQRSGGKVLANFQMAQDLGAIIGPILIGAVAQSHGFEAGFLICGVVYAIWLVFSVLAGTWSWPLLALVSFLHLLATWITGRLSQRTPRG